MPREESTLLTVATAVDLLHDLCAPGVKADLATNPPIRLLVVDDDPVALRVIGSALQMAFEKSESADRGEAAREGLLCPAYCLMPDHVHLVWMGLRRDTDQRNGMKFFRAQLGPFLQPAKFQHQAHDHVLTVAEREQHAFSVACADYVLLNLLKAELVKTPTAWPYLGAVIPGYLRVNPFEADYWPWFWKHYFGAREPGIEQRVLPPREMA